MEQMTLKIGGLHSLQTAQRGARRLAPRIRTTSTNEACPGGVRSGALSNGMIRPKIIN